MLTENVPGALRKRFSDAPVAVLVRETDDDVLDARVIRRPPDHIGALHISPVVVGTPDALVFHRTDAILPQRAELAQISVVFVGLGSLGGAIALALARSGITRFVLIDPDILEVENLSRHIGVVAELGRPKVEIIEARIRAIQPDAHIIKIPKALTWDLPSFGAGAALEKHLGGVPRSLLISTCVEPHVDRQINALAIRTNVPAIFAAALGAAEHGRVFRVVPGVTPCYACICASQDEQPDDYPRFALEAEAVAPYVQPALPGLGVDVTQIATVAARFALQTIARAFDLDLGLADEHDDHLLWTNRGGWLFDRPLQAVTLRFPRRPDCVVCRPTPAALLSDQEAEALARLTRDMMNPNPEVPAS